MGTFIALAHPLSSRTLPVAVGGTDSCWTPSAPRFRAPFEAWVRQLAATATLTHKGRAELSALRSHPRESAFGSTRAIAELANVNIGTVTRAAQALGYAGWTEFQHEFRARYVASLSVSGIASEHALNEQSAEASLARDRADLNWVSRSIPADDIRRVASEIARAGRTVVLAQRSYAAVGIALAHNAAIVGYDVRHVADPATMANAMSRLTERDLVVAINSWQIYASTLYALRAADKENIRSILITDSASPALQALADFHLSVPSEGVGFFPSLVSAVSLAQAVVVELATLDPERTTIPQTLRTPVGQLRSHAH
jgi:DNA-binding MurR/RpiR family transcriptional regulator